MRWRENLSAVIARSEAARQSRKRRTLQELDCFVERLLAMTAEGLEHFVARMSACDTRGNARRDAPHVAALKHAKR